jgi:replication factor C subunit 3/5
MNFFTETSSKIPLNKIVHHKDICNQLLNMNNIENSIFYGPSGSGKKTLILSYLAHRYGKQVYNTSYITKDVDGIIELIVLQSPIHCEVDIKKYSNHDKTIVMDMLKEEGSTRNIKDKLEKIVIIRNADYLSYTAQCALRRIVEVHSSNLKLILILQKINKIIDPLLSRFILFRVPAPSYSEIHNILCDISYNEGIYGMDLNKIALNSDRNIKNSIVKLQIWYESKGEINYTNYDDKLVNDICDDLFLIIKKKDISYITNIKNSIYKAIISDVHTTTIIKKSLFIILNYCKKNKINDSIKLKLVSNASNYQIRMINHCKDIMHLEAFYYSVINILININ